MKLDRQDLKHLPFLRAWPPGEASDFVPIGRFEWCWTDLVVISICFLWIWTWRWWCGDESFDVYQYVVTWPGFMDPSAAGFSAALSGYQSCCGSPRFTEVQWNLLACILHCCRGSTSSNEKAKTTRTSVPYFWVTVWDFCDVYQWQFPGVKNCRNPPSRTTSCSGAGLWYCFAINRCIGKRCQSHQYWHLLAFAAFGRAICPEVHSVNAEWVLHHDFWHHGR